MKNRKRSRKYLYIEAMIALIIVLSCALFKYTSVVQEIATELLKEQGAIVTQVANGAEAVRLFKNSPKGSFDVILMDVMMPIMDGLEATRKIRALDRIDAATIPIIALTANAFYEDVKKCIESGMNAHLSKPLEIEKVVEMIVKYTR